MMANLVDQVNPQTWFFHGKNLPVGAENHVFLYLGYLVCLVGDDLGIFEAS